MAKTQLPGLGLIGNFADGENNWGADMNRSLLLLSGLVIRYAQSKTVALASNAPNGTLTIVPAGGANANRIAIRAFDTWNYIDPWEGARFYIDDEDADAQYTAAGGWQSTLKYLASIHATGSVILDKSYIGAALVLDGAADKNITIPSFADKGIPVGAQIIVKRKGTGVVNLVAAGGVNLDKRDDQTLKMGVRGSEVVLWQDTQDNWDVQGGLELTT